LGLGITLCLTAGGRPDLLADTLTSLLAGNQQFIDAFAISNDYGDDATSAVARSLIPTATIIHHPSPVGHHKTIDELYALVLTPYILHCEDDWHFDPVPFLPQALELLREPREAEASQVLFRQSACVWHTHGVLDTDNPRSFGYSLNPSLLSREVWARLGPFAHYPSERDLGLAVHEAGLRKRDLVPGVCFHTGAGRHLPNARPDDPPSLRHWRRLKRRWNAFRRAL